MKIMFAVFIGGGGGVHAFALRNSTRHPGPRGNRDSISGFCFSFSLFCVFLIKSAGWGKLQAGILSSPVSYGDVSFAYYSLKEIVLSFILFPSTSDRTKVLLMSFSWMYLGVILESFLLKTNTFYHWKILYVCTYIQDIFLYVFLLHKISIELDRTSLLWVCCTRMLLTNFKLEFKCARSGE